MEGKENFIRILAFSAGPALAVIQFYLENEIIRKNKTFETYLNIDKHKHLLFHEYIPTIPCCQCKILSIAAPRRRGCLVQRQFFELFNASVNPIHELRTGNKVNEHCICSMAAKPSVEVSNLDISLLSAIIHKCCYDSNTSKWIQEIRDVRNRFAHSGDATLDKTDFDNTWQKLETATLNFARRFGKVSNKMFKQQIDQIKTCSIKENRQQLIDIIQESPELNHSVNGMSEQNRITRDMFLTRMDEFQRSTEQKIDGLTLKIDNFTAHVTMEVEKCLRENREGSKTNAVRQITVATQVDSSCFDEEAVAKALDNAVESDIDRQSRDREKFHVTKVERNCIELELVAFPDVFKSPQQLQNAIKILVRQLIVAGEIDTNDSSDLKIRFKVKTPLTTAEIATVSSVFGTKYLEHTAIVSDSQDANLLTNISMAKETKSGNSVDDSLKAPIRRHRRKKSIACSSISSVVSFSQKEKKNLQQIVNSNSKKTQKSRRTARPKSAPPSKVGSQQVFNREKRPQSGRHVDCHPPKHWTFLPSERKSRAIYKQPFRHDTIKKEMTKRHMETKAVQTDEQGLSEDNTMLKTQLKPSEHKDADMDIAYFYQLVTFLVDIAPKVVHRYFELFCLKGESFEEFLNANKHLLFHLHHNLRCCQCNSDHTPQVTQYMSNRMFSTLFRHDSTAKVRSHMTKVNERVVQLCMCPWEPRPNLDVSILDLSLVNIVMKTCFTSQVDANMWIKSIVEVRNDIFHKSDAKSITLKDFESTWFQLDHAVMRLATLVSPQYNHEINHEATLLKGRDIKSKDKLNVENLCLEYWKLKCGDFERQRREELENFQKRVATFTMFYDSRARTSLHSKIERLCSLVDKVSIAVFGNEDLKHILEHHESEEDLKDVKTIPVLMQMEIPKSWDDETIQKSVESMRSEMMSKSENVKIKACFSEELTFLVEFLTNIIRTEKLLKSEINKLIKEIFKTSGVNTKKKEKVNVSMLTDLYQTKYPIKMKVTLKKQKTFYVEESPHTFIGGVAMPNSQFAILTRNLMNTSDISIYDQFLSLKGQIAVEYVPRFIVSLKDQLIAIGGVNEINVLNIQNKYEKVNIPISKKVTAVTSVGSDLLMHCYPHVIIRDSKSRLDKIPIDGLECRFLRATKEFIYFIHDEGSEISVYNYSGEKQNHLILPDAVHLCTVASDGGLYAVTSRGMIFHISEGARNYTNIQSIFEPMTNIIVISYNKQSNTLLFCYEHRHVSVYTLE